MGKNPPAVQEIWVQSLDLEDPLGKGMATHSSILAWRIPWTGAWWATIHGAAESDTTERNNILVVIYMKIYQKDKVKG